MAGWKRNRLSAYSNGRTIVSRDAPKTQICSPTAQSIQKPTTTKKPTPTIKEDVILECYPGHVYVGGVTGARHQVIHDQFDEEEALLPFHPGGSAPSSVPCSVTFMFRSCVFADRSRTMDTTPNPRNVWNSFTACVRQLINDPRFRLPSFEEYMQAPCE